MHATGSRPGDRERLFGDDRDAAAVDVLHREYADAGFAHQLLLAFVEVTNADEDGMLRQHFRREAADARELCRLRTEQRRERHPVNVTATRRRGSVLVAMRVDPDEPERSLVASHPFGGRGTPACGDAVIAAEHE